MYDPRKTMCAMTMGALSLLPLVTSSMAEDRVFQPEPQAWKPWPTALVVQMHEDLVPRKTVPLGYTAGMKDLIGVQVFDFNGKTLGSLDDLLLDPASGHTVAYVIAPVKGRRVIAPVDQFNVVFDSEVTRISTVPTPMNLMFTGDPESFSKAPIYSRGDLEGDLAACYRQFGGQGPQVASADLISARKMIGSRVNGQQNDRLGKVSDIIADLQARQAAYVLITPRAHEAKGKCYPVPPEMLQPTASGQFVLKTDSDRFLAGPSVVIGFDGDIQTPEFASSVYQYYNLGNVAMNDLKIKTTGTTVAGGPLGNALTPTGRPESEAQQAFLAQYLRARIDTSPRDVVHVKATQGHIELSGFVGSQEERQQIQTAAQNAVGQGNVDNKLQVR